MNQQIKINFDAGLTERFPEFKDMVKACVYGCGRPFKHVAADLDMTSAELSRKLSDNPNDPVEFPLKWLPNVIEITGDLRPIHWLIEKFCETPETRRGRAIDELSQLMPHITALLKSAQDDETKIQSVA